jgi:4-hydroxy-tetrahydrodipicolinate synthase
MVTPFNQELQVDYGKARKLARYLVDNGSDGIVVAGTTGESPTITFEEKLLLMETVVDEVGNEAIVIGGTGSNNTSSSIELTREAVKTGIHGIMLVTPYYNKPPQEGLYQHFKSIAEVTDLPVMLYNVPGRTMTNLLPETVAKLAQIENIVALKEACGNMDQISLVRKITPPEFQIFSGDDSMTLPMLAVGCQGVVSVASHVAGPMMQKMLKAFFAGKMDDAAKLHYRLMPLFKGLFMTANPIPVKAALNMIGVEVGGLRLPLIEANQEQKRQIRVLLEDLGIL